jgi:hypothetical protein
LPYFTAASTTPELPASLSAISPVDAFGGTSSTIAYASFADTPSYYAFEFATFRPTIVGAWL